MIALALPIGPDSAVRTDLPQAADLTAAFAWMLQEIGKRGIVARPT